jgi:hypothetical protein
MEFCGIFIKFGDEEHLKSLQKDGLLFCNPLSFFTKLEDGKVRGDNAETIVECIQKKNHILQVKFLHESVENYKTIPTSNIRVVTRRIDPYGNLFCLHAINTINKNNDEVFGLDINNKKFGSHFLLITDTEEFLKRLNRRLKDLNLSYEHRLVEYIDLKNYEGKKSIFQKDIAFSYQKEFRLFIYNKNDDIIKFKIGDLSDISILYSSSQIEAFKMKIIKNNNVQQ